MKPIDVDKTGIGFIRHKNNPIDGLATHKSAGHTQPDTRFGDQLVDLLSIVRNSREEAVHHSVRLDALKQDIRQDTYIADVDLLVDNIMVFDYE
ncbi:hypothetical protein [Legionella sp. CNM-4043-24]|uniref:hypothetical protein n=1 Tax=Legionella sp. CNM-4043-24 TaxID=3421646 RepID=UPI00403A7FD0